ncbi:MAG TPA: Gfo/Idh/MocA family oxidoreductase [Gaiellales bacterium]|jgi:predicted dehydrogenase
MAERFEPVRLGIAGTGFIAAVHAACAQRSPFVELAAVASARGRASRERFDGLEPSVQLLTLDELFASADVEAIMVCTRTSDHAAHAVEVLKGGKHLLLEKPGAVTVSGQSLLTSAAAEHPELVARVAYHRRHDPLFREVAERLAAGEIGAPFAVHLTSREDYPPSEADLTAGGFIMDVGVHDFDTARWYLGRDPTAVFAQVHAPVYGETDVDNAYITIALGDAAATVNLSRTSTFGMDIRCEVVGPGGTIRIAESAVGGGLTVLSSGSAAAFPEDCRARFPGAYQAQMDAFARACRGEETDGATLEDDRWAVATAVAARASGTRGERLEVGPSWDWNPAVSA